jgi:hypothetical protein
LSSKKPSSSAFTSQLNLIWPTLALPVIWHWLDAFSIERQGRWCDLSEEHAIRSTVCSRRSRHSFATETLDRFWRTHNEKIWYQVSLSVSWKIYCEISSGSYPDNLKIYIF